MSESPEIKKRRTIIGILQGDDLDTLAELTQAVRVAEQRKAETSATARLGDSGSATIAVKNARADRDAFIAECSGRAVTVELEALTRREFRAILAQHPARKGDDGKVVDDDVVYGVNVDTCPYDLIPRSIIEPTFPSAESASAFVESLPDGEIDRLFDGAYWLNRARGVDPKELTSLTESQN